MSIAMVRDLLLWCSLINYGLLILWFVLFLLPHDWFYRLWGKWFHLRTEQFDAISFAGIMVFKIGILLFNVVPYIALRIVQGA